jgi:ComF family protein
MKYGGQFHLRRILADWLWEAFSDPRIQEEPYDAIVPIPLHPARLRERGFNQAQAIGEIVARRTTVSLLPSLQRRHYTETQTRFDRKDRMRNLRNAFALRESMPVIGKKILLVDDVLTTGSTLHECALVLRTAGADSVRAVTVARG